MTIDLRPLRPSRWTLLRRESQPRLVCDPQCADIPLPVRPFGSQTAYASVEEALQAFVAPETLDGNNQYWCDVCAKKCDAHKGLKFSRFPYLLTLHLKRFDFDYNTLHRIKLNDKVGRLIFININSICELFKEPQRK